MLIKDRKEIKKSSGINISEKELLEETAKVLNDIELIKKRIAIKKAYIKEIYEKYYDIKL